eukprot:365942-Chlamydomonas_euryale.AAC.28
MYADAACARPQAARGRGSFRQPLRGRKPSAGRTCEPADLSVREDPSTTAASANVIHTDLSIARAGKASGGGRVTLEGLERVEERPSSCSLRQHRFRLDR